MENKMFCFQCQETAGCKGCTQIGVCGKLPDVANMQDLLVYVTKGLSEVATALRAEGKSVPREIGALVTYNLFVTITNANFDKEAIIRDVETTLEEKAKFLAQLSNKEGLTDAANWDGNMDEYEAKAKTVGVLAEQNEDIRSLKELITYGLKGLAAYEHHANMVGRYNDATNEFVQSALADTLKEKSVDELIAVVKEVADAIDAPLVVEGCKNVEKDAELLPKVAEALQGRNVLILSEKEENYKAIGAAAGLAYDQIVGAESAVDINLAKQLNVVTTQLGVNAQKIVMNIGSAAAGYGYEYVVSTMDRIKGAALSQNDNMLQMPIITPVSAETWGVKEATASEADMPEWGPEEERGIDMEVMTAAADLAAGSDAVILRHPEAVAAISRMIKALA